ncbi:hypothetical protein [Thermoflavifilum thermophilum]|uniref:N-acetyltransferase domain-containing protein n=1 Tax=Thermoflavifilum thermophilum TaxID=1393122 RepID=A0A1I7N892_9BACT|nr:hypothetical protein [Thermoflavifilum thermophilum]SFV30871.1 hypothetical protein SAMN05660895_0914 [Thermoflavifilum thermophilum]
MHILPVENSQTARAFLLLPRKIYAGNPEWIEPLHRDIEEVFDPRRNKAFRHGECARWILVDDRQNCIGRVAAFVNQKYKNKGDDMPVGGIGFFECVNDRRAAHMLFDQCRAWLQQRGMQAMDGPINFGERDKWWGLLVEGFHAPPYGMNYHPPYYRDLFESYGFEVFFNQYCYAMRVDTRLQDKFYERHAQFAANPDFHAEHYRKKDLEKFAADFCKVYNEAWAGHGGLKTLELKQVIQFFRKMNPVADEHLVWFVYYKNEPIGCWLNIPDINQAIRYLHGHFSLWHKLKFIWLMRRGVCKRFIGLVFGIVPAFQGKGVDSYLIIEGAKVIQPEARYEEYEMQWIGDFNPKMINIAESLGTYRSRRLITYRYLFDRSKLFQRHPMV